LPTGTGKTYIGLVIGEYRRQAKQERIAYLCLTQQLARQTKEKADRLGVKSSLIIGRKNETSLASITSYNQAQSIAITTYSKIFNSNPQLEKPQILICDDVHGAESYLSSMWELNISKIHDKNLFNLLMNFFYDDLDFTFKFNLENEIHDNKRISIIHLPNYYSKLDNLKKILHENCVDNLFFSCQNIINNLEACNVFITSNNILIKPLIAPTLTHSYFSEAKQRIFMSATLGFSGDLQRITGVEKINFINSEKFNKKLDSQRLTLFPDLQEENMGRFVSELIEKEHKKTIVLAKEDRDIRNIGENCKKSGIKFLTSQDIDTAEKLEKFLVSKDRSLLGLANRYDGIDFSDSSCNQMILLGLPNYLNLQEKFFWNKISARTQYNEKIANRITQAIGRCTRSKNDSVLVLLLGVDLLNWCTNLSNTSKMHPQIQAEIKFGTANSTMECEQLLEFTNDLFNSSDDWKEAYAEILKVAEKETIVIDEISKALADASIHEIGFIYSLWSKNYFEAYGQIIKIIDNLKGGAALKPYKAFWHYMASKTIYLAYQKEKKETYVEKYYNHIQEAKDLIPSNDWLSGMKKIENDEQILLEETTFDILKIRDYLQNNLMIKKGEFFNKAIKNIENEIMSDKEAQFVNGVSKLGFLLGFESKVLAKSANASPDVFWNLANKKGFVFEAKSEEKHDNPISDKNVKQVNGQVNWILKSENVPKTIQLISVMLSHKTYLSDSAWKSCAEESKYLNISTIRDLFFKTKEVLEQIRTNAVSTDISDEELAELIYNCYTKNNLSFTDIMGLLQNLNSLPKQ